MSHFVCTGECGGVSEHVKVCEGEDCSKKGHLMAECHCEDDGHEGVSINKNQNQEE